MTLERTEIDGIPTFWTAATGSPVATLLFRVGIIDEPLLERGTNRLIQQAALGDLPGNWTTGGQNGLLVTSFRCHATEPNLVRFFGALGNALSSTDPDRLAHYQGQLIAADVAKPQLASPSAVLLEARYGFTGPGVVLGPELALHTPDPVRAFSWAARHFTRQNAAFVFAGRPPENLRVSLPTGTRTPEPQSRHLPGDWPASVYAKTDRVTVSMIGRPRMAFLAAVEILHRAISKRLSVKRDHNTTTSAGFERVGAHHMQALIVSHAPASGLAAVQEAMAIELDRHLLHGVSEDATRLVLRLLVTQLTDPRAVAAFRIQAALDHLLGAPMRGPEEMLAELKTIGPDDIVNALWEAQGSILWLLPTDVTADRRFPVRDDWSHEVVAGTAYEQIRRPEGAPPAELRIGPHGISVLVSGTRSLTVRWDTCAAVTVSKDGMWRFYDQRGTVLRVDEFDWRGPSPLRDAATNWVAKDRIVRLDQVDRERAHLAA